MTREEQAQYISKKLMENPEFRKAFVGAITDAVNEVVKVIKALQQEPCTDAISRQAAIDALGINESVGDPSKMNDDDVIEMYERIRIINIVKKLPPVTPQYTDAEIQKMQDLEFAEIQKAYEIGKAEKPNKWIPVSERYPEDGQRVLVDYCDEDAGIMLTRFNAWGYHGFKAWMPLPEPYKASPTGAERRNESEKI